MTTTATPSPDSAPVPNPAWRGSATTLAPLAIIVGFIAFTYRAAAVDAWGLWMTDPASAHCLFILPIVIALCWILRDRIRAAATEPSWTGFALVTIGLIVNLIATYAHIRWVPLVSLVAVVAGLIIGLHGQALWRVVRFPVLFLVFLSPPPATLVTPAAVTIQQWSTAGAVASLTAAGLPVAQNGFFIDTPTISVEVTRDCSGFNKLTSLLAFSVLYGYLYALPWKRRLLLVAAVLPVALFANVLRIFALVVVGSTWGVGALHSFHDSAEVLVVVVSFVMLTLVGKGLGCNELRDDQIKQS
ncbi:MAG TPA: exosortase/archaeosortase family protein [Capsulimonadaceae bacterium]|jgi:exosortase